MAPLKMPQRGTTLCIGEACAGIWAREAAQQTNDGREGEMALQTLAIFLLLWLIFTAIAVFREISFRRYLRSDVSGFVASENEDKLPLIRNIVMQFERLNEECPAQIGSIAELEPCPVCLDNINSASAIRKLCCSHVFHISCIDRWVLQSVGCQITESIPSCPVCKAPILQTKTSHTGVGETVDNYNGNDLNNITDDIEAVLV